MSKKQIIERLRNFVGGISPLSSFNPVDDWNAWRIVEEKVMEDEKMWLIFIAQFGGGTKHRDLQLYCEADLPTRCKALCSVLEEDEDHDCKIEGGEHGCSHPSHPQL